MKDGLILLAAGTPRVHLANPAQNAAEITAMIHRAAEEGVHVLALPELCLTGYSCGDLFFQQTLLDGARQALSRVVQETAGIQMLVFVGVPLAVGGKLYNCAAAISDGRILGVVPKTNVPNYAEFYEARHFAPAPPERAVISLFGADVPFGQGILFACETLPQLVVGAEICEDLWVAQPPSAALCAAGATVVANLSASSETVGKDDYRRMLVKMQSARLLCAYLYADCGAGESSTDLVFAGHTMIADCGTLAAENPPFGADDLIVTDVDLDAMLSERRRMNTYPGAGVETLTVPFALPITETKLRRAVDPHPFIPAEGADRERRCRRILEIQAHGLARRLEAAHAAGAVVAISGGLDSCLALLVTAQAFDLLSRDRREITTMTMPCYGTTRRTKSNAQKLSEELGTSFREVDIAEAVAIHFRDIGHDPEDHSVVYENAQARERTQIIMDIANANNSLVIGTGDLSELALGWATYNGDHMSNYGVNAGLPKTLIRYIVAYCADTAEAGGADALAAVLRDILATPVSPELLPAKDGEIAQKTEDIVGPYDLHDFFLYHLLRRGERPAKIYRLACAAFAGVFECETIAHWLKIFCRRFFTQQFKRSCLPDGPKVGSVALSPRGDWRMPSDAESALWLEDIK